jgi:hypothetical protein
VADDTMLGGHCPTAIVHRESSRAGPMVAMVSETSEAAMVCSMVMAS